ncbi:hypothetical protein ACIQ4I_18870 [Rummeliibacillus sp. NPDC094406]|uniref:hypothetical protein n=1 Tax=Rummeliibacillus sp. NPDC094406 TaxID=3364511 RepID=UPI0038215D79
MMIEEFNKEISYLKIQKHKRDRVLRRHRAIEEQIIDEELRKDRFEQQLRKETKDVEDLDRFSFLKMFRKLTGKQGEIRQKEIAEMAAAEAKWRESEKMITTLEQDLEETRVEAANSEWENLDERLDLIIAQKKLWIFDNNLPESEQIKSLYQSKDEIHILKREIAEALTAGDEAKRTLKFTLKRLDSAENYSSWDTIFGGGFIATAMKHSELDEAEDAIHKAQRALQRFHTELVDVRDIDLEPLIVEREGFTKFADYFFDDVFSAWTIHSRIQSSQEHIEEVLNKVEEICNLLDKKQGEVENKEEGIAKQLSEILG